MLFVAAFLLFVFLYAAHSERIKMYIKQVRGGSRSMKMAPFDRPYATFNWSANLVPFSSYLTLNNIVTLTSGLPLGHPRSLKLVPFKSLAAVSYSPSIVTMTVSVAVCEILSIKEWCDLENRARVRSRSLEMAPFDRTHMSSYLHSIVTMAIYCIICEI